MKKLIYSMLAMVMAAFTLTSCEDVPAPYDKPSYNDGIYINETLVSDFGPFTAYTTNEGKVEWTATTYGATAKGMGYDENNKPVYYDGTAWLVSPTLDLSEEDSVQVSWDQAIAFAKPADLMYEHHELYISTDYVQGNDPSTATWTKLSFPISSDDHTGKNYDFSRTGITLSAPYMTENVTLALKYTSTSTSSSTWEVKNFLVMRGGYTASSTGDDEGSTWKKTTKIADGVYAIAANTSGSSYAVAQALTGNYGYLQYSEGTVSDNLLSPVKDNNKFTFKSVSGGYTIQDADGYYVYMTGTYNSFNRSSSLPESGHIWTVTFNADGTANIKNNATSKTIQFSSQYSSYGAYSSVTNTLPCLFSEEGGEGGSTDVGTGDGTKDNPYTVAQALALINALDADVKSDEFYVKGIISSIKEVSTSYGNANYYISDDGTTSNQLYVFRGLYLDNVKFTSTDQIQTGDQVVILAQGVNYKGNTPELAQGNYIVSLTRGGSGSGSTTGDGKTAATALTATQAAEIAAGLSSGSNSDQQYYIKGTISNIKYEYSAQYGTATFYISEDGTSKTFCCYSLLYFNNKSWVDGDTQIKVGDEVVVYGYITNYNGTYETASKKAYLYSLNGATSSSGSSTGGSTGSSSSFTRSVSGTTLTFTGSGSGSKSVTIDLNAQGWSNTQAVTSATADGVTYTFDKGDGSNEPKYYTATKGVRMYAKNTLAISGVSGTIAKVVMTCDSYNGTDYVGNETATGTGSGGSFTFTNEHSAATGGTQLRVQKITVYYD